MNKEHIVDAMGRIDDDMIEAVEALRQGKAKKKHLWLKWGAIAAAACLTFAVILPFVLNVFGEKGDIDNPDLFDDFIDVFDDPYDDSVHSIAALEYNGCFYEAVDIPDVLVKYGLPKRITSDMAGEHLSYLESDGGCGYRQTISQTDIELYVYAPKPCRGVYVLRDGDTWYAALFCNFIHFDSDTHCEFTELYRVYGIESAEDIASITEVDWNNDKVVGNQITDSKEISEFYDITLGLMPYGNDSFQKLMFSGFASEEDQMVKHTQFADDHRSLRIETTSGLRFHMMYSCSSLGIKIGGGIGTAICGWLLDAAGYIENAASQPDSCIAMLNFLYLWAPMILCAAVTILLSFLKVEKANKLLIEKKENA